MPTSAVSHAQTRARPDRKKARQSARQSVASSTTAVTQRELPSVGVGPGRKPSTAHSIPGRQPSLGLGLLLALCGFEVPEALRAEDLGMISPEVSLSIICGDGRPLLSAL